jgi:hypothetical protein
MITISNTTLCCIDCDNYLLSLQAIRHSSRLCHFDKVLFLTDSKCCLENTEVIKIPSIRSKEQYSLFVVKELINYIDTDFVLLIQYDGFIIDPDSWTSEFHKYDYIGAKWLGCTDGLCVGNGGFSLRSRHLLQVLSNEDISAYSKDMKKGEDYFICRAHRPFLESRFHIKFASEAIADKFSYECSEPVGSPFGFHGLFNMWRYIKEEDLTGFVSLLSQKTLTSIQALKLGIAYHKLYKFKQAETVYCRILQCFPDNTAVSLLLEMVYNKTLPQF